MPMRTEVLADRPERRQEALGMPWRLETLHVSFTLPCRLVRILCPIVEPPMAAIFHARHDLLLGSLIAAKLVSDEYTRHILACLEQFAEEFLRGSLVAPALHQDIEHIAVLIDGPPQVVGLAVDLQENLIEEPLVAWSRTPSSQLIGIGLPEPQTPLTYRLVRHNHATFRE